MRTTLRFLLPLLCLVSLTWAHPASAAATWQGAWRSVDGSTERVLLVLDGYWTLTHFQRTQPAFHRTFGGPFEGPATALTSVIHFDSADAKRVGKKVALQADVKGSELRLKLDDGPTETWQRIPETTGALTGVWRISGRDREGKVESMPLRARRTLKVLTGTRFQWIAMNIETGEFSGTGGGTYTFENGTYTETIEFFSRDSTRVGARLAFEGSVKNGDWHHKGLSSRGEPIYEIWSRMAP